MKTLPTTSGMVALAACSVTAVDAGAATAASNGMMSSSTELSSSPSSIAFARQRQLISTAKEDDQPTSEDHHHRRLPFVISRGGGSQEDNSDDNHNDDDDDKTESKDPPKDKPSSMDKPSKKKKNKKKKGKSSAASKRSQSSTQSDHSNNSNQQKQSSRQAPASNAIVEEILQQEDYYSILGISTGASDREITKAYRRRCVQTHPDKTGGDRRAFDRVAEAYDALADQQKRQLYDRFGKAGLAQGGSAAAAAGSYQDVFRSMFQQATQQRQKQQRRNASLRYQLQVTLEDLYYGGTQTVTVNPPQSFQHHQQFANRNKSKEVDVHIPKGSINGQSIVLSGEVDFNEDVTPGDLIFVLTQAAHPTFTRKGHDLAMELTIGLEEALCGMQRPICHLNGKELLVESARTETGRPLIIQTGDVQVLKGWGMPKRNSNGDEFGDLYIQYRVEMPKAKNGNALSESEVQDLSRLLTKLQGTDKLLKKRSKPRKGKENISLPADQSYANSQDGRQNGTEGDMHILLDAKVSDFGTASGKVSWDKEEDEYPGNGASEGFHPFASAASGFFGGRTGDGSSSFYFGNFGNAHDHDDGNTQCQQM